MSKRTIKPLGDRVVIEIAPSEGTTESGIIIPDTAIAKPLRGTAIAVGPGKSLNEPMTVKEGDTVLYGKYSGTEVEHEGQIYLIVREADIFAIV